MAKKTRAKQDRGTAQNPASEHHGDDLTASLHARSPSPIPIPAPLGRNSREFEEDTENLDVSDRQIDSQFPSASGLPNSPTQSRTPSSYIGKANLRYSTSSSAQYAAHDRRSYGQTSVTGQPVQREVSLQGQRQTYVDDDSIYWAQANNRSHRYGDEGSWPSPNNPPMPVPAPGITGEAQPHNRVRFAESSAPTQLMSPQVASAQSALSSSHPSPNFSNEPKRLRVNIPPTASSVPPSANASWSPDTGMYAAGWKSWAAEAQKLPKSMQTPLGNRNRMPLPSHTYQYAQGPPSHPVSHTMSRAQNSSGASRVTMDATAPGQMGWTDLRANNSWGSALRRGGGGDQWEDMGDEEYDEDYDEDGQHTHVYGSNTMGIARSNAVIPLAPSTSHPRRAVDAGGTAIEPAQRALFGHDRDSKDRLHWDFDPNKDPRVHSALEAVSYLAYDCVQMGIRHFLQGQQRGALFCNVSLNIEERQELPLDWLSLPDIEKTRDVILYRCTAYNDPMHEVLVFVFLMSRTGNSIAIWRKRVTIPEELLQQHAYTLAALKQATHPTPPMTAPTTTVETEPESVVTQPSRSSKLGKKRKEKDPNKPKRKKWWQFWKKKAKTPK